MKGHLIISGILFGIFLLISCDTNSQSDEATTVQNIKQEEFLKLEKQENTIVLDVRTPEEVQASYIEGADLFIDFRGSAFESEIEKLDKEKSYVLYCRSGGRSSSASELMISKGFKHVYNLEGGISNWTGPTKN